MNAIVQFLKRKSGKPYFCNNCFKVHVLSYKEAKTDPKCVYCESKDIVFFRKKELESWFKKSEQLSQKLFDESRMLLETLKNTIQQEYPCELKEDSVRFDIHSYVKILRLERNSSLFIHFHYFSEKEPKVLDKIVEAVKKFNQQSELLKIKEIQVHVDSRWDHCRISKEKMLGMGFKLDHIGDYVKTIEL